MNLLIVTENNLPTVFPDTAIDQLSDHTEEAANKKLWRTLLLWMLEELDWIAVIPGTASWWWVSFFGLVSEVTK